MKKLVVVPLTLLLLGLAAHHCHGATLSQNDIDEEYRKLNMTIMEYVKNSTTYALKNKELISPAKILAEVNKKVQALKAELGDLSDRNHHNRVAQSSERAIDTIHEHMPQRVIVHTNCPSACVKVECYAEEGLFLKTVNEEKRYLCTVACGDKCRKFLQDSMKCYQQEVSGECGLHESHNENIKLACDDRMTKCLIKKVAEDDLIKEENSLKVGTNDKNIEDRRV